MIELSSIHRLLFLALLLPQTGIGNTREVGPDDDLRASIASLKPGDELILKGGNYELNESFRISVIGNSTSPITIRAKDGETPLIDQKNTNHNVMEVFGSRYLKFEGISITGGSHGIRLMDSDFITIQGCDIYETGDVAISANSGGTYTGLKILENHVHHTNGTGEGMYLGCNNDACRVENSLIAGNYVHHTNRPGVEQGDGIELKEGSSGNIIRDNVIHDTNFPGILVYSTVGNGSSNIIEGNAIWNTNDFGIQAAADVIIRNNVVLGSGVGFQSHQAGRPANIEFVHNTVISDDTALQIRNVAGPITVANNAIYSANGNAIRLISGDTNQVTLSNNMGDGGLSGGNSGFMKAPGLDQDLIDGNYDGAPPIDLYPAAGSVLIDGGNTNHKTVADFNGNTRNGTPDVGAYEHVGDINPGWQISESFKQASQLMESSIPKPPVVDF